VCVGGREWEDLVQPVQKQKHEACGSRRLGSVYSMRSGWLPCLLCSKRASHSGLTQASNPGPFFLASWGHGPPSAPHGPPAPSKSLARLRRGEGTAHESFDNGQKPCLDPDHCGLVQLAPTHFLCSSWALGPPLLCFPLRRNGGRLQLRRCEGQKRRRRVWRTGRAGGRPDDYGAASAYRRPRHRTAPGLICPADGNRTSAGEAEWARQAHTHSRLI
jgi:hypothetical protein